MHSKIMIIGSGPAGYSAAIYAARAMLEPVIIQGLQPGGQLTITVDVENYPGFATSIEGPWLMEQMKAQAENVGTKIVPDIIVDVNLDVRPFQLTGDSGTKYTCDSLVIATGAQARWLGLPSEEKFKGFGVSACATCDGFFYRDKKVLLVGGGNTAIDEALFLSKFASKVIMVHRRDELRAEQIMQKRLFANKKITLMWNTTLEEILGDDNPLSVTGVKLKNTQSGDITQIDVHGVFIAIGHAPATSLFKDKLAMKPGGYLITAPDSTATAVPGVFAAGDVTDDKYRQAVTAAGMGCMATLEAEQFLASQELSQAAQ